jgi:hypothetical protein
MKADPSVMGWFWYALGAGVLYGTHQIFTKLAADKISDGLGGFVVEATAALAGAATGTASPLQADSLPNTALQDSRQLRISMKGGASRSPKETTSVFRTHSPVST